MIYWLYFSSNWNMYLAPRFWLWGGGNGYGHLYDAVWTLGSAPWLEFDFVYLYNEFYPIWILGTIIYINLDGKEAHRVVPMRVLIVHPARVVIINVRIVILAVGLLHPLLRVHLQCE